MLGLSVTTRILLFTGAANMRKASVATTSRYVSTNVEMKREALEAFWRRARIPRNQRKRWQPKPDIIAFLQSL